MSEPDSDTCRPVEIDGEIIRVRGSGDMSDESQAALAEVIRAAKRRFAAEHPARLTVDTITSDQLDALQDELASLRRDNSQLLEDQAACIRLEAELQRLRQESPWLRATAEDLATASAAIARARALAAAWADPKHRGAAGIPHALAARAVLAALDGPKEPTTSVCWVCEGTGTPIPDGGGSNEKARDRRGRLITHPPQPCPDCPKEPTS